MLESLKLFNYLKAIVFINMLIFSQSCASKEELTLNLNSLQNPEELTAFVNRGVSQEKIKLAEKLYQSAIQRKNSGSNWGAAYKYFAETALIYPTAQCLLDLAESEANFRTQSRFGEEIAIKTLNKIENYLNGAIAVDKIQKKMSRPEIKEVKNDIQCLNAFLTKNQRADTCKYIDIIYSQK